jgi:hypothetical protein
MIENWAKARQFEDAMVSARSYYEQLFDKVGERASKRFPGRLRCAPRGLSDRLAESAWEGSGGCASFTNPTWHSDWPAWPTGIWISNISLDELVSERSTAPNAAIWLSLKKSSGQKIEKLRERLLTRARKDRVCRTLDIQTEDEDDGVTCIWYYLPEEQTRLLNMVLKENGQPFVDSIAKHVETMARLLQGSDDLLHELR